MKSSPEKKGDRTPFFSHNQYRMLTSGLKGIVLPLLHLGKHHSPWKTRCRHLMGDVPRLKAAHAPHIWIHAASLGEAGVSESLVRHIQQHAGKKIRFTLSACTATGVDMLEKRLAHDATIVFAPLDAPGWPEAALTNRPPDIMVFVETEIWPNWIRACAIRRIPVLMVNGRISPRSFPRYLKARPLLRESFCTMQEFSMISDQDARRILALGAAAEKIRICGNAKKDPATLRALTDQPPMLSRKNLGIAEEIPLWICGSIRKGEESPILEAFCQAKKEFPDLCLILAPRHLKRLGYMERAASRAGLSHQRRSQTQAVQSPVLFLDTMGELRSLYALADVVFCGGSLVPAGGQNLLEAAAWGKPILFGPSMEDFMEERDLLLAAGAAFETWDAQSLCEKLLFLLRFPEKAKAAGKAGLEALRQNADAIACHSESILRILDTLPQPPHPPFFRDP